MKNHVRIASVLLLAASLAGCNGPCQKIAKIAGPKLTSGTADFTRYVAVGTSISAGYESGGLVNRHQITTFPARFAQQVGFTVTSAGTGTFSFPAVDGNGIGPLLQLLSLVPPIITSPATPGNPINIAQVGDYQNLAIPGSLAYDFADSSAYHSFPNPIGRTNFTMFNIITRGRGRVVDQALRQAPTFISFEYGANEVLGSATAGTTALIFPSANYAAILTGDMNAIHASFPNTKLAMFNVPDVTVIPFFTTWKPYTVSLTTGAVVPLVGLDPVHDLVLLTAKDSLAIGTGIPVGAYNYVYPPAPGNGRPLPGSMVLTAAEQSTILAAVTAMNAAVDSVSQRPWIAKVDLAGTLAGIAANGYMVGSTKYTSAFVTGGIFSLDGVHPTDLAHAILANTMIDAVNARFGSTVPRVNVGQSGTLSSSSLRPTLGKDGLQGLDLQGLDASLRMIFPRQMY